MADILFMAKHKGGDSKKFHRLGDPIVAMPGNHVWSQNEDKRVWLANGNLDSEWPGIFFIVRIRGLSVKKARKFLEPHTRPATAIEPEFNAPDAEDRIVVVRRKRWRLNFSEIPLSVKKEIKRTGFVSVSLAQISPFFRHRYSGKRVNA